jgi:hypothetical protein
MTPIIFHQNQTREQKIVQLAQEVSKAGGLAAFFSKLSTSARHGVTASQRVVGSYLSDQRVQSQR